MGSFKRALFGYRRPDVDAAIAKRDARIETLAPRAAESKRRAVLIGELEHEVGSLTGTVADLERETASLSAMVIEREREIRGLGERLREANERHDRSISSLDAVSERLEEIQSQARGQATRIRMKALREAVEVSRRVQALTDVSAAPEAAEEPPEAVRSGAAMGAEDGEEADGLFEGQVRLEIGPLGDFSQLVGFEDAIGRIGAAEISVERFSEGRATLSMRLDEPTELVRELEQLSSLDFRVRHTAPDNLVLDVDEDQGPEQRAA